MLEAKRIRSFNSGRLLFSLLVIFLLLPLASAFLPLFQDGFIENIKAAIEHKRFFRSFSYGISEGFFSAIIALIIGLPGAYFVSRRKFFGKRFLSSLSAIPLCTPPLVIALGFVMYYGREGYFNKFLMFVFNKDEPIIEFLYSFWGVVITHGLYNFPLVTRLVGDAWNNLSKKQTEAAKLLGTSNSRIFFTITIPALMPAIGAAFSLIFLICFYSFVIVLLFGGPGVGTPEVELYNAARLESNYALAGAFALFETIIAFFVLTIYGFFEKKIASEKTDTEYNPPKKITKPREKIFLIVYCLLILVFFIGPLLSIVINAFVVKTAGRTIAGFGFTNFISLFTKRHFLTTLFNSLLLGLVCGLFSIFIGFSLSVGLKKTKSTFLSKILPLLPLALSSVVLSYGWTRLLGHSSILTIALVQAVSAYPYSLRAIQSSVGLSDEKYVNAAMTLGSSQKDALFRVRLPMAKEALLSGFTLSFAMSVGDANAVIIAPVKGFNTASLLLYQLAGSYRFNEASSAAVIIAFVCAFIFYFRELKNK